jgi:polar amino acid transport system ATP-binding protein
MTLTNGSAMIGVDGLVQRQGAREVLRGLSLEVARGEVAVVIGSSGSGKSTLLRCLDGLESFQEGSVTVDGLTLTAQAPASERARLLRQIRRRVGMIFQGYHLFPHRTVLENVTEGPIHVLGMDREPAEARAVGLLEKVGLADRLRARPCELSGGEQQRVAIARALALEPQALLCDEPTSALDPRMTREVLGVLTALALDGLTMIVVTHAMGFARRVAHSVHVLSDGRIIESGPPAQIFDHPCQEATRQLLQSVPDP